MVTLPFVEHNGFRTFSADVDENELKWHWDEQDRTIVLAGITDWMLQMDNELPKPFPAVAYIKAGTFHRVIKGTTTLIVEVIKHDR